MIFGTHRWATSTTFHWRNEGSSWISLATACSIDRGAQTRTSRRKFAAIATSAASASGWSLRVQMPARR
eukprot:5128514-Pyramimonas_sp.AAC.1